MDENETLTVAQVAREFRMSPRTVYRLMAGGFIKSWVPPGLSRPRYTKRGWVLEWMDGPARAKG